MKEWKIDCEKIVEQVLKNEEEGWLGLEQIVRQLVLRLPPIEGEDKRDAIQDALIMLIRRIQTGHLTNAYALIAFAKQIVWRQHCRRIIAVSSKRGKFFSEDISELYGKLQDWLRCKESNPEELCIKIERDKQRTTLFSKIPVIDQIILREFYINEKPWPDIVEELNITATTFRVRKSRSLQQLGKLQTRITNKGKGT